jgi:hypothetical protein
MRIYFHHIDPIDLPNQTVKQAIIHSQASEVPKSTHDNQKWEKMQEKEDYRRARIQIRATEKLKEAQLPSRMAARGVCVCVLYGWVCVRL